MALEILYELEVGKGSLEEVLDRHSSTGGFEFAEALVRGVKEHLSEVDRLISGYAEDWKLERMPVVDRNVLRIGIFEILFGEVPTAVAINEAVELAKTYSTADSGRFVNGVLARIASEAAAKD